MREIGLGNNFKMAQKLILQRRKIAQFPFQTSDFIKNYQWDVIKKMVAEAYAHVPFYRERYAGLEVDPLNLKSFAEFEKLPTISKNDLVNNERSFVDDRYDINKLICSKTSGSSGVFLDIYCPEEMFVIEELQVLRMLKELCPSYNMFSREVLVYTSKYPVSSILGFYKAYYINNLESAATIFEFIREKKPTIVAIYPSILREIISCIDFDFQSIGIKLILTNSEQSTQMERDYFSRVFNCVVKDEFSSEEVQSIAYQCKENTYHEVSDCSYIEILKLDTDKPAKINELGEIVGTCLINNAMPIIRYRQGDLAQKTDILCTCGKKTLVIGNLMGRNNASFKDQNGKIIPSGKLLDWSYSLVLEKHLPIRDFQIIQLSIENVLVKVVLSDYNFLEDVENQIQDSFIRVFGDVFSIEVERVPYLKKTSSGKHHSIISLL